MTESDIYYLRFPLFPFFNDVEVKESCSAIVVVSGIIISAWNTSLQIPAMELPPSFPRFRVRENHQRGVVNLKGYTDL